MSCSAAPPVNAYFAAAGNVSWGRRWEVDFLALQAQRRECMKLREVRVQNFRCLADVTIPIGDMTVLVGANNSGKTAFLDALRIALSGNRTHRRTLFDEYDYHMTKAGDSPQTSQGIVIELWFREDAPDEWPDSLLQALDDISLKISSGWRDGRR